MQISGISVQLRNYYTQDPGVEPTVLNPIAIKNGQLVCRLLSPS